MLRELSCDNFTSLLASAEPVPGGGGASALCGALGAALCAMAARLTVGKKKFAAYTDELDGIITEADSIRSELMGLIDADAEGFAPLAAAYAMPKDSPDYVETMTNATLTACKAPFEMMRCCVKAAELLERLYDGKCSALLISDVGCAAAQLDAALRSAAMNVFVNTKTIRNNAQAIAMESTAKAWLTDYIPRVRAISQGVLDRLSEV